MGDKAYKFRRDSHQYQVLDGFYANKNRWHDPEVTAKMEEFLGCSLGVNSPHRICCDAHQLSMRNPPEHLITNFKKPNDNDVQECKIATKLNKGWQKLCKELGVKTIRTSTWAWELGWFIGKSCKVYSINGDYYVEPQGGTFDNDDFLEPIDMPTFLRIRADWEESQASK